MQRSRLNACDSGCRNRGGILPHDHFIPYHSIHLHASTSNDFTTYYVSLPVNQLEPWALIESDRYRHPVFREFYSERDVVYEERRMRIENDPGGKMEEQLYAAAFTGHPYGVPVIGWPSDLSSMTREETACVSLRTARLWMTPTSN